ncbi:hypothetical protein LTR27_012126 [Elasticomyces elasticus]|nr:hypothetical protein LTR27_012126 [Elasticomyces elasticus]
MSGEKAHGGGAWGLGLFQSDWDYDLLQDLSWDCDLLELEMDDAEKQGKKGAYSGMIKKTMMHKGDSGNHVRQNEHDHADLPKKKDDEVYYNIYSSLCSSPKRVRQWIEKTAGRPGNVSILQRMLVKHMALAVASRNKPRRAGYKRPGYTCVLLGAAAMSLGCKLPADYLQYMRDSYTNDQAVGLMRDALKQMKDALGPDGYKNDGTPYDFLGKGCKGLHMTLRSGGAAPEDCITPGSLNVPSPAGPAAFDKLQEGLRKMRIDSSRTHHLDKEGKKKKRPENENLVEYGNDVCGGCGAKDGEKGKVLINCSKCMGRLYCGRDCQKSEWAKHKLVCKAVPV